MGKGAGTDVRADERDVTPDGKPKGSEKFWINKGAEALLQLVADELCTSQPLIQFWKQRYENQTGYRAYSKYAA